MTFFNDNFETGQDTTSRRGIIIAGIVVILLVGFFIWYQRHFSASRTLTLNEGEKEGFFSSLLHPNDNATVSSGGITDDSDQDGLSNQEETQYHTDSQRADSDNDGLSDGEEVKTYGTNPNQADSDGDGKNDGEEIKGRFDPNDPSPSATWPPRPAALNK